MKTKSSSPEGRGARPTPPAKAEPLAQDQTFPGPEWRGVLEYDHDHGHEVLGAKRENLAHGHNLLDNE